MSIPVPRLIAWELTRRCNLRCAHCRANAGTGAGGCGTRDELSFDEAKAVIDDIASFARPILILTGGEPLLCDYLFELIAYAREKGLNPVIGTNATLIDDAVAARIATAGVARVSVSVDFPSAAEHDGFRGVPGAFDAAVRGIRALRAAGVGVQVNTTVTRRNSRLLGEMHDLAVSLGARAFHPFLLVPTGRGADLAAQELSAAEYEEALRWICERQATSPLELKPTDAPHYQRIVREMGASCGLHGKGCLAGTGFAFIGHAGDVQPCGYFDVKLGNVRETPLSRIWRDSPVLDDLRHPERLKGKCGVCEFKGVCGGCRARAFAKTGDYLAEEPFCAHVPGRRLFELLQVDFPLVERPYAELGRRVGLSEEACYERALGLRRSGLVRRIGASFRPERLGCESLLVAARVSAECLDEVSSAVSAFPHVTHNYSREGAFNLWFTLIAESGEKTAEILSDVARLPGVSRVLPLPSEKSFKLRAVFVREDGGASVAPKSDTRVRETDWGLVRKMQGDVLDAGLTPFSPDELVKIRARLADGTIRRFGAFANHRAAGFVANALLVWDVPPDRVDEAGTAIASEASVSHCCLRVRAADWPYNLYAMAHARSRDELLSLYRLLSDRVERIIGGPTRSEILSTVREYKKTSMVYCPADRSDVRIA